MTQYRGSRKGIGRDQGGLTLVELLISMLIAGIIGIAVLSILYTMYNGRAVSEKLTGRSDRAILMKEALEHTVTNAGYTAYTSSSTITTPCAVTAPEISPALPVLPAVAPQISSMAVSWTVDNRGTCNSCMGTFSISGNVATWTTTGGAICGQGNNNQAVATFPVGTGWTISAEAQTSCLGPAFNTTAPAIIATNISSQDSGTNPVEVSACMFNLQGQ